MEINQKSAVPGGEGDVSICKWGRPEAVGQARVCAIVAIHAQSARPRSQTLVHRATHRP